ncbi:hypothetical protein LB504_007841 [Fusarium proliferatum]|nr:hypothetical protein LB504_007841 [Fusarium proliferatum]
MGLGEKEEGHDRHDSFLNAEISALSVGYDVLLTKMVMIQNTHLHPRSFATKPPMTGLLDWAQEITSEEYRHHKASFRKLDLISNASTPNVHRPSTKAPSNKPKDNKRGDVWCKGTADRKTKSDNIANIEQ